MAGTIVADNIQAAATSTLRIQTGNGAPTTAISIDPTQKVTLPVGIDGDLKFNSGYGSIATAYGCRAWVNFDGTANSNLTGTYSQTGTTVTVTATAHGFITGNSAFLDFTSGTAVDGAYEVTVTGVNTFTVTQASRTTSGNVTVRQNTIRASGNVSSIADNGTGDYTVNFTTAMPDANYCTVATCNQDDGVSSTASIGFAGTNTSATLYSTTAVRFLAQRSSGTNEDESVVCVSIFR
jgi:hypothetical protein